MLEPEKLWVKAQAAFVHELKLELLEPLEPEVLDALAVLLEPVKLWVNAQAAFVHELIVVEPEPVVTVGMVSGKMNGYCSIQDRTDVRMDGSLYQLLVEQAPVAVAVTPEAGQSAVVVVQYVEHDVHDCTGVVPAVAQVTAQ